MDIEHLSVIVALLAALSVAAERLVEIIKTMLPWLAKEGKPGLPEPIRKLILQLLPILASIVTVMIAWPVLAQSITLLDPDQKWWESRQGRATVVAIGFLVSGGSGFWNKVVDYVGKVGDLKDAAGKEQAIEAVTKAKAENLLTREQAVDKAEAILKPETVQQRPIT